VKERENNIETRLNSGVKKLGGWSIKLLPTFITGLPDRMVLLPIGIMFFVELKSTKKTPSPAQLWVHKKLRGLGFNVFIIDSIQGVKDILECYE